MKRAVAVAFVVAIASCRDATPTGHARAGRVLARRRGPPRSRRRARPVGIRRAFVPLMQIGSKRLLSGAAAGIVATGVMTAVLFGAKKTGLLGEVPPKKLTRKIMSALGLSRREPKLTVATTLMHVGFGATMGALYGALPRRYANAATGSVFGLGVWAASYAGWIPSAGLMPKPSWDRPGRPPSMILAHLVYGATLGEIDRVLR